MRRRHFTQWRRDARARASQRASSLANRRRPDQNAAVALPIPSTPAAHGFAAVAGAGLLVIVVGTAGAPPRAASHWRRPRRPPPRRPIPARVPPTPARGNQSTARKHTRARPPSAPPSGRGRHPCAPSPARAPQPAPRRRPEAYPGHRNSVDGRPCFRVMPSL